MSSKDLFTEIADLEESTWRALTQSGEAMVKFITTGESIRKPDAQYNISKQSDIFDMTIRLHHAISARHETHTRL